MPSLGPSEQLLRAVQSGRKSWAQFSREYLKELFMDGPIDSRSKTIKNHGQKFTLRLIKDLARKRNVTLMCHCAEDQQQCHQAFVAEADLQPSRLAARSHGRSFGADFELTRRAG